MLTPIEGRIVGVLLEKERTVPDQYPLSLNAVLLAANQSSNRDPVMSLDEREVEATLTELKSKGLVRFVHPTSGRGVTKFRQVVDERTGLEPEQVALLGVLLVRGPQTAAELRARAERLHAFSSLEEVERVLRSMSDGDDPLVQRLERLPGQSTNRWQQLYAEELPSTAVPAVGARAGSASASAEMAEELATLRRRIDELEARLARLEQLLD